MEKRQPGPHAVYDQSQQNRGKIYFGSIPYPKRHRIGLHAAFVNRDRYGLKLNRR
jgi:hypothetical protein